MKSGSHLWRRSLSWLLPAAVVLAIDQVTKAWVASHLAIGSRTWLVGHLVSLTPLYNSGAAFSLLPHQAYWLGVIGVAAAVVVAVVAALTRQLWLGVTLGVLLGGIIGNLISRFRGQAVLDFIKLPHWPAFNVADMAITVAAVVLILESWAGARGKGGGSHR